jgi:HNH endonuclease
MAKHTLPTFALVDERLAYNPQTGIFVWKITRAGRFLAGTRAGHVNPDGYVVISILNVPRKAHRIAWLLSSGEWPPEDMWLDHINRDRSDNRLCNLRLVSHRQNAWNTARHSDNIHGFKGVTFIADRTKPWQARIYANGKGKTLGYFATAEDAHAAYLAAATRLFGEFAADGDDTNPRGRRRNP